MADPDFSELFHSFSTADLCSAHPGVLSMDSVIAPLFDGARIVGWAATVKTQPGQNAAIHRSIHLTKKGAVLVVDVHADRSFGFFGDILATCCRQQGIVGLVIDGAVRDVAQIKRMRFPVFCIATNPTATSKDEPGLIDLEIQCGGVRVRPNDIIVGDDDGVVVIPRDIVYEVSDRAALVVAREREIMSRLAEGLTSYEILELSN